MNPTNQSQETRPLSDVDQAQDSGQAEGTRLAPTSDGQVKTSSGTGDDVDRVATKSGISENNA